jgi:hypothetical protein
LEEEEAGAVGLEREQAEMSDQLGRKEQTMAELTGEGTAARRFGFGRGGRDGDALTLVVSGNRHFSRP